MSDFEGAETLVTEAFRGFRTFNLVTEPDYPYKTFLGSIRRIRGSGSTTLRSLGNELVESADWVQAQCRNANNRYPGQLIHGAPAPQEGCTCGFYSLYRPEWQYGGVTAVVALKGKILLGDTGMRAEYQGLEAIGPWSPSSCGCGDCHPKQPLDESVAKNLRSRYGVPVFDTVEEMVEAFPAHDYSHLVPEAAEPVQPRTWGYSPGPAITAQFFAGWSSWVQATSIDMAKLFEDVLLVQKDGTVRNVAGEPILKFDDEGNLA